MADLTSHPKRGILSSFPLLALVLIAYNAAMFSGRHFSDPALNTVLQVRLISGAMWVLTWDEVLLASGLLVLFIELIKSTRTVAHTMFEHMLSMVIFIIFLVEFLVVAAAGTSTFLLLGIMSLIDVLAGYSISIAVARKEMNITG